VPAGDGLSARQRERIEHAVQQAEKASGLSFAVWVGTTDDADLRAHAEQLHASAGGDVANTVLVAVEPARRKLEIVTGATAHIALDDRSCGLAAATMASCFNGGDLVGGIVQGLASLADHSRHPQTLHLDQP